MPCECFFCTLDGLKPAPKVEAPRTLEEWREYAGKLVRHLEKIRPLVLAGEKSSTLFLMQALQGDIEGSFETAGEMVRVCTELKQLMRK